jgi:Kef-type K+ transport system membrane component KefB/nucleotide-binding universal stress UspA family protein
MISDILLSVLPVTDPVLKFLIILLIILFAPLLFTKIKLPHILGLIIAGALVGPNGFNLLARDESMMLLGTAGLLYIMFLAGLELDMIDFKKNSSKSLAFGLYTFLIPMILGTIINIYFLKFSIPTSVLLSSMYASHTLIAYPILSKFGVVKNRAVNVAVGGTIITDTLTLLVLSIVVGMMTGNVNALFWTKLSVSILVFGLILLFLFPFIGRWFLKSNQDNVSQYIFVLVMVFSGSMLAKAAGIEPIIGAFLSGLALNRLIPATSPLMNRTSFVGNAIFIPFFLISVGMLVDYRAFFTDPETIKVAAVMTLVAAGAKFLAAWATQKTFRFTRNERSLIFGLNNAHAAATLAIVMVGYNVILGESAAGEPIRLFNDNILNGTIIMILITCTMATFSAQKGAKNIALSKASDVESTDSTERILIPISNPNTIEELICLSTLIRSGKNKDGLFALNIINSDDSQPGSDKKAKEILEKAQVSASATDTEIKTLLRYDLDSVNGIANVIRENNITDLVLGLHAQEDISDSFLGKLTEGILVKSNISTFVYRPVQPISTVKRHLVIIPENAEYESGFSFWLVRIWNIAMNTGTKLIFYASEHIISLMRDIQRTHPIEAEFNIYSDMSDFLGFTKKIKIDDNIIVVLSRKDTLSFQSIMNKIPTYLITYFRNTNFLLVYPAQSGTRTKEEIDLTNPSLLETIEKIGVMGKTIANLFRKK